VTRIDWTDEAVHDLEAVRDYIARDSEHYAASVCADIVHAVERLAVFPEHGRIVPELRRATLRELIQGSYRVVYRLHSLERVEVLTVFHGARLLRLEGPG